MELNQFQQAFGTRLRTLRKQKGISLLQLSVEAGMSEGYLSKLENGKINATLDVVRRLSLTLNVTAKEFFNF